MAKDAKRDEGKVAVEFQWIDGPESAGPRPATEEEWTAIDDICAKRGWPSLNRQLTRILVARAGEQMVGFHVMQLFPHAEPLWTAESERGTGLAEKLADQMYQFLTEVKCRGWLVIADSPHAEKLCQDRGMAKVNSPVYLAR